ncbi:hypothetical protein PTSG_07936 [Salpingoeca rosetta]|uniref:TNFR-Cys domain-containing protein n=1 Tax=Salpingoeca rosetta (strain ATCC 50818 / BSB-021) TaxID=946362 RepID=F2UGR8_SALR5|nr:uncharacterized protein PTSG_07936 [Salpingoeca rosetta]EGD75818.1 hypothetical protein PTSG_07936 [Salpingoeca rosetta]|eukprot:XP_004991739.1 hypothetical protein PTSG_07936 [Salpingoeca rosetta]
MWRRLLWLVMVVAVFAAGVVETECTSAEVGDTPQEAAAQPQQQRRQQQGARVVFRRAATTTESPFANTTDSHGDLPIPLAAIIVLAIAGWIALVLGVWFLCAKYNACTDSEEAGSASWCCQCTLPSCGDCSEGLRGCLASVLTALQACFCCGATDSGACCGSPAQPSRAPNPANFSLGGCGSCFGCGDCCPSCGNCCGSGDGCTCQLGESINCGCCVINCEGA